MEERIQKMKNTKKKGFTLVELLVVIAIMAILALIAVPNFYGYIDKSRDARIQSDLKKVYSAAIVSIEDSDEIRLIDAVEKSDNFNESIKSLVNFSSEKDDEQNYDRYQFFNKQNQLVVEYEDVNGKIHYYPKEVGMIGGGETGETEPEYSEEKIQEIQNLINNGYTPIATAEELDSIRNDEELTYGKGTKWEGLYEGGLGEQYVQVANIDLSGYSGEGWNPIGNSSSSFTGTYDGGNYVIKGLEVKGEGEIYQGLFGATMGATICNVGLIDNKVTGNLAVGGLVGFAWSSNITDSYATGSVTGTGAQVGGLVGYDYHSTITNSYWDTETTERNSSAGGGLGKTTEEMMTKETYTDWDFEEIWKINEGNDYPKLR